MARKLTNKQIKFVEEYLIDLNATQAAIRAGYPERSASVVGCQNLIKLNIQAAIKKAQESRSKRTGITADRVLDELEKIAFFNIKNLFNEEGQLKSIHDLDDDTAAALGGIDVLKRIEKSGEGFAEFVTTKFRQNDKNKALEMVMRHLGMFNDKIKIEEVPHEVALSELE